MEQVGKFLIITGIGMALLGGILWLSQGVPWLRFGRLPGDIAVERNGFGVYFPIVTCILLSLAATLVLWVVSALRR